jgi:hypothetical protein
LNAAVEAQGNLLRRPFTGKQILNLQRAHLDLIIIEPLLKQEAMIRMRSSANPCWTLAKPLPARRKPSVQTAKSLCMSRSASPLTAQRCNLA